MRTYLNSYKWSKYIGHFHIVFLVKSSQYPEIITIITFIATSILSQRLRLREFEERPGLTQALGREHAGPTEHGSHLRRLPKVSGGARLPHRVSPLQTLFYLFPNTLRWCSKLTLSFLPFFFFPLLPVALIALSKLHLSFHLGNLWISIKYLLCEWPNGWGEGCVKRYKWITDHV